MAVFPRNPSPIRRSVRFGMRIAVCVAVLASASYGVSPRIESVVEGAEYVATKREPLLRRLFHEVESPTQPGAHNPFDAALASNDGEDLVSSRERDAAASEEGGVIIPPAPAGPILAPAPSGTEPVTVIPPMDGQFGVPCPPPPMPLCGPEMGICEHTIVGSYDWTVRGVNNVFELHSDMHDIWACHVRDSWVVSKLDYVRQPCADFHCSLEYDLVTWRLSSQYLLGCIPEGYWLLPFIETVPDFEWYTMPLHACGPTEPRDGSEEAEVVDPSTNAMQDISLNIAPPPGELPTNLARERFAAIEPRVQMPGASRAWRGSTKYWNASLLNHQPLYFEDVNLDRHGFTYGWKQPFISGAKFFATIPAMPYLVAACPPNQTQYTLGESRPGDHAPYVHVRPPVSASGAALQAGVITGLIFFIP